jgi:hypothetical protein
MQIFDTKLYRSKIKHLWKTQYNKSTNEGMAQHAQWNSKIGFSLRNNKNKLLGIF